MHGTSDYTIADVFTDSRTTVYRALHCQPATQQR
ncbi:hypothetical protein EV191_1361 [Tamaricihabitans halophyticus]|uniref:Uncharacterized protein n=1 Tax=Tamaricihabitans halophyticus TaxID=1262583 RepID=A0A4R2PX27_9PSEU|nr:hypothetical protein EV191_1361 [Tamaricihabitans halophyticus]